MALRQHGLLIAAVVTLGIGHFLGRATAPGRSGPAAPSSVEPLAPSIVASSTASALPSATPATAVPFPTSYSAPVASASSPAVRRESARLALALHHLRLPSGLAASLDPTRPGWPERLAATLPPPERERLAAHLAERRAEDIERAASLALADYQAVLLLGEDRKTDLLGALARHFAATSDPAAPADLTPAERLALADAFLSNAELAAYRRHLGLD